MRAMLSQRGPICWLGNSPRQIGDSWLTPGKSRRPPPRNAEHRRPNTEIARFGITCTLDPGQAGASAEHWCVTITSATERFVACYRLHMSTVAVHSNEPDVRRSRGGRV